MKTLRVLLVEDDTIVAHGLHRLLELDSSIHIVGIASNGQEALGQVRVLHPDVVVMDVRMQVLDGVAATRRLRAFDPQCNILFLTTYDDDEYVLDGLRAGARGYLLKKVEPVVLVDAIHRVARGEMVIHPDVVHHMAKEVQDGPPESTNFPPGKTIPKLTPRELEVMYALIDHQTNKQIAQRLVISESTVKNHVEKVLAKLEVLGRQHVEAAAREAGLL